MIDQFIVGTFFVTSLIGLLLLLILRPNKMRKLPKNNRKYYKIDNDVVMASPNNRHSSPESVAGPDVIIVGAGVAGAALAHTLGTVRKILFSFFFWMFISSHLMT